MNRLLTVFLSILVLGCSNEDQPPHVTVEEVMSKEGFDKVKNVFGGEYKRYVGTIAGQQVVANLVKRKEGFSGSYYYEKVGSAIRLYGVKDGEGYSFREYPPERTVKAAHWDVKILGDSILGNWISGDSSKMYSVSLAESYGDGVMRMGMIYMNDTVKYKESLDPKAEIEYKVLVPVTQHAKADYVRVVILSSLGCDSNSDIGTCIEKQKAQYFDTYTSTIDEMEEEFVGSSMNNWSRGISYIVQYNEDDVLVIDNGYYEYSGGAHGNYSSDYINIDCNAQKVLSIEDVMVVDTNALLSMLTHEIKRQLGISKEQSLDTRLFSNELNIPSNFYITGKGVTFSYGLYEIASYADGIIEVFIPYSKLMSMLKPEFKQRMNLTAAT